jgi:hypothetical protein
MNLMPLESRAVGTHLSTDFSGDNHKGIKLYIRVTNVNTTGTLTVTLQELPPTGGAATARAASASLVAAGDTLIVMFPGIAAVSNSRINDALGGGRYRLSAAVGTAAVVFSVDAELIG